MKEAAKISTQNKIEELNALLIQQTAELTLKNRELEIEAALERVRSRTMDMQKSEDLNQAASEMFKQIEALEMHPWGCGFNIFDKDEKAVTQYMSLADGGISPPFRTPLTEDPFFINIYKARQQKQKLLVMESGGESLAETYRYMLSLPGSGEIFGDPENSGFEMPKYQITHCAYFSQGYLVFITYEQVPEVHDIFQRFAKVFEQTYTRFLDLQKAEMQAREAQIEASLERVRSQSMAMHHTSELQDVINTVHQQFKILDIAITGGAFIAINEENCREVTCWGAGGSADYIERVQIPYFDRPIYTDFTDDIKKGAGLYTDEYSYEEKMEFFNHLFKHPPYTEASPDRRKKIMSRQGGYTRSTIVSKHTTIFIINHHGKKFSDADNEILKRFGKAFDQTYTRFLDLQKAEAQAREAKIEAALEKVRSRLLAMHTASELGDVVTVIVEKLLELDIVLDANGVVLCTYFPESKDVLHWIASPDFSFAGRYLLPWFDHPIFNDAWQSKKSGEAYFSKAYSIEEKNSFFEYAFEHSDYKHFPDDFKQWVFQNDKHILSFAWQKNSAILIPSHTGVVPTEDEAAILKRFAKVFEQAYVRFMDLQKAEAQTREAQIEAALERVRSRTMGMQRSDELQEAAALMFQQVENLGVNIMGCGFNIWDEDKKEATAWMSGMQRFQPPFKTLSSEDIFKRIFEAAENGEALYVEEQAGDDVIKHYEYMTSIPVFKKILDQLAEEGGSAPSYQIVHCAFFKQGYLMFISLQPVVEAHNVFKRFAKIFEQTYTRFLDLQKAEVQAREAIKQASLNRVRGEIASMRTKDDLDHITPLIWKELTTLGIPFIRCGVFIMDEVRKKIHTYLSTPDGRSLSAFEMAFNDKIIAARAVKHWRKNKIFREYWDKNQFLNFMNNLLKSGQIKNSESFQGLAPPPETLYLNFVPFKQGMLYVGNISALTDEVLQLMQSLADSFSIAYARYEDFKNLEEAKNKIEMTLNELKAAQSQLIQSEKMASLGELTAGIAHEIQNPLNFVNNFSEVSKELVEEFKSEKAKGKSERDEELEDELLNDIEQNLVKINHHGKRAADIVKGMLQHSRTSSGQKEPTDINALADEYLRLAYHGLRAKDKSFNADFKTHFDPNLPKINVIPQDIGRVLLNLINNAFYAVNERSKKGEEGFKPIVSVSTVKVSDKLEIKVADNGPGIPEEIKDKIFQPFFTTKPTGRGTGLGLSLSYDIVKAHGGELKVETKEGEGTEFIIIIPV